jgi:hypothetical protein
MLLIAVAVWGACTTPVGATMHVPSDSAATCGGYCQSIGLTLESVVIMANNVGCVCAVQPPAPAPSAAPPASAGGMAAIMMQEAAEDSQRQQQSKQNTTHH